MIRELKNRKYRKEKGILDINDMKPLTKKLNGVELRNVLFDENFCIVTQISARSRETGKFLVNSDGNVQCNLHRIYNSFRFFADIEAWLVLPAVELLDTESYNQFFDIVHMLFGTRLRIVHDKEHILYGKSITEHKALSTKNLQSFVNSIHTRMSETIKHALIEQPVFLEQPDGIELSYNFNWNKTSDDVQCPYFDTECTIADIYPTTVFNDVQYNYMKSKSACKQLARSTMLFSEDLIKLIASYSIIHFSTIKTSEILTDYLTYKFFNYSKGYVFFSSRIDDPRYDFKRVVKLSKANDVTLIVFNYLDVENPKIPYKNKIVLNGADKAAYYKLLTLFNEKKTVIPRYETDMHIGFIEQYVLCNHKYVHFAIPHFTQEIIQSYLTT